MRDLLFAKREISIQSPRIMASLFLLQSARCALILLILRLFLADALLKIVGIAGLYWSASGKCSLTINREARLTLQATELFLAPFKSI